MRLGCTMCAAERNLGSVALEDVNTLLVAQVEDADRARRYPT